MAALQLKDPTLLRSQCLIKGSEVNPVDPSARVAVKNLATGS